MHSLQLNKYIKWIYRDFIWHIPSFDNYYWFWSMVVGWVFLTFNWLLNEMLLVFTGNHFLLLFFVLIELFVGFPFLALFVAVSHWNLIEFDVSLQPVIKGVSSFGFFLKILFKINHRIFSNKFCRIEESNSSDLLWKKGSRPCISHTSTCTFFISRILFNFFFLVHNRKIFPLKYGEKIVTFIR